MLFHARPLWWRYLLRSGKDSVRLSRSRPIRQHLPILHSSLSTDIPRSHLCSSNRHIRSIQEIRGPYNASDRCMEAVFSLRRSRHLDGGNGNSNSNVRPIHRTRPAVSFVRWTRAGRSRGNSVPRYQLRRCREQLPHMIACPAAVTERMVACRVPGRMRELIRDITAERLTEALPGHTRQSRPEWYIRVCPTQECGEYRFD